MIVGAYAAANSGATECDIAWLADRILSLEGVTGLELPYTGAENPWLSLRPEGSHVVTLIPALFAELLSDTAVGLASSDSAGRREASRVVDGARRAVHELGTVRVVHLQSSGRPASAAAFSDSLAELCSLDWAGARLVVEHCDALVPSHEPQKGFLSLVDELGALPPGVDIAINWGRSVIETRDADGARRHIEAARAAGRLAGVMFSGASSAPTAFGAAWADAHLPPRELEPASLMDADAIDSCMIAAGPDAYLGIKVSARPEANDEDRLRTVAATVELLRSRRRRL